MATQTAQMKAAPTPASTQSTAPPAGAVVSRSRGPIPPARMPGPRLFASIRVVLIIVTVLATASALIALAWSEYLQESTATYIQHHQAMDDLEAHLAYAHSVGVTSLLTADEARASEQWEAYRETESYTAYLLLSPAAASPYGDLEDVTTAIFAWQEALSAAHAHASTTEVSPSSLEEIRQAWITLEDDLHATLSGGYLFGPAQLEWIAVAIGAAACCVFLVSLVVIARRTHRVINIGIGLACLAMMASTAILGVYLNATSDTTQTDARMDTLSQVVADTWQTRSLVAMSALWTDPMDLVQARQVGKDIQSRLDDLGLFPDQSQALVSFLADTTAIDPTTSDPTTNATAIMDATVWEDLASPITDMIDQERVSPTRSVYSATDELIFVGTLGIVAFAATLAGIFVRTREYA